MADTKIKIKQSAISGRSPSADPTNSAYIEQGELALNTADQLLFSKDSNGNIFSIGGGGSSSTIDEHEFIATAGQTDFTITGGYATGDHIEVYVNGIKLWESIDFTHTNGSEVVLAESSELDDEITVKIIGDIDVAIVDWAALTSVPTVITNIQTELDDKVDDTQVLTDVPANALFTDTQVNVNDTLTSTSTTEALSAKQGKVLQDSKVDNSRVLTDVPANALFTDTVYTKPAAEPISYITGLQTALDDKATLNDVISLAIALG
jgi:hypothetical protein